MTYPACSCNVSNLSIHTSSPVEPIVKMMRFNLGEVLGGAIEMYSVQEQVAMYYDNLEVGKIET